MDTPTWIQKLVSRMLGNRPFDRPDSHRVTLGIVRVEDRVLLDAAGVLPELTAGISPTLDPVSSISPTNTLVTQATTLQATVVEGVPASTLEVVNGELVFQVSRANQVPNHLVVTSDAQGLTFRDDSRIAITSTLPNVTGSGTNEVRVGYGALADVRRLVIDVAQDVDTVTFDFSRGSDSFLSQFDSVRLLISEDHLRFIGDGRLVTEFQWAARIRQPAVLSISNASDLTRFEFQFTTTVDVTGMSRATLLPQGGPNASSTLLIEAGSSFFDSSRPALVARYNDGSPIATRVNFYDNDLLVIDGSESLRSERISVLSGDNGHGNSNLVLTTQNDRASGPESVRIDGDLAVTGDLLIRSDDVVVNDNVEVGGRLQVDAQRDINISAGGLSARNVFLTSATGRITMGSSAGTVMGGVIELTAQAGIGTLASPLITDADQIRFRVTGSGSAYIRDVGDVLVENGVTNQGEIRIASAGVLQLGNRGGQKVIDAGGNLFAEAETLQVPGSLDALGNLSLTATTLDVAGDVSAESGSVTLNVSEQGVVRGRMVAADNLVKSGAGRLDLASSSQSVIGNETQLLAGRMNIDGVLDTGQLTAAAGSRLTGGGLIRGTVIARSGATVAPGSAVSGSLSIAGDLRLEPGSTLALTVSTGRGATFLNVSGAELSVDGATLLLSAGQINADAGVTLALIRNGGTGSIMGSFVDASGNAIPDGNVVGLAGSDATVSYTGGTGNDLVLIFEDKTRFIPLVTADGNEDALAVAVFVPEVIRDRFRLTRSTPPIIQESTERTILFNNVVERVDAQQDVATEDDFQLYYRVRDDALGTDGPDIPLPADSIGRLPDEFAKLGAKGLPDGHYRVYLQEAGSTRERLVQEFYIFEGKLVPKNFREIMEADATSTFSDDDAVQSSPSDVQTPDDLNPADVDAERVDAQSVDTANEELDELDTATEDPPTDGGTQDEPGSETGTRQRRPR